MTATVYTDLGKQWTARHMNDTVGTATGWYIGWGTGGSGTNATASDGDLDLFAAATEARVTATSEDVIDTTVSDDTTRWISTLTAGTAKTIQEVGLFNHVTSTATAILIHANHGDIALATDDQIQYTIDLQFT